MSLRSPTAQAIAEKNVRIELPQRAAVDVRLYGQRLPGGGNPLVLHFHGGGFVSGDLDSGSTVARLLAAAGAVVVSLAYPLAPSHPFPDGVDTGYDVLLWVHKQRVKLAGQGARIFLAGEEAGGNIAAAVTVIARDRGQPAVAGQILLSPLLDPCVGSASQRDATATATAGSCKWYQGWKKYLRCPMDAQHPYAVPGSSQRLSRLPPTLVLSGLDDPLRDEAKAYAERLRAAGITVTYDVVSKAQNWPAALTQTADSECPGAGAVRQHLRDFFAATGKPLPLDDGSPGSS